MGYNNYRNIVSWGEHDNIMGDFQDLTIVMGSYTIFVITRYILQRKGIWKRPELIIPKGYKANFMNKWINKISNKYPFSSLIIMTLLLMLEMYLIYSVV